MPEAHIPTERLRIRMLAPRDQGTFVAYRNIDSVARYQNWPLPYHAAEARKLIEGQRDLGGPTPGRWVQLAITDRDNDRLLGDVAIHLDHQGVLATVGYTLAPDAQGHGYAVEATGTMVDWLFRHTDVHRVTATMDPANVASARVVEQLGFDYVGTAKSAAWVRGAWEDDARFTLTEPDRAAWLGRTTSTAERVELTKVDSDNLKSVLGLSVAFHQKGFVAPAEVSIAQAAHPPLNGDGEPLRPWYRAIVADDEVVGFVMVARPTKRDPYPYLWRLLVDFPHQGRGIGKQVVLQLIHRWRRKGYGRMKVSWVPEGPGNPARFYDRLGFVTDGVARDGEVDGELKLK